MKFLPEHFSFDYVTKERAARTAQELFDKWVLQNKICLHPNDSVYPVLLSWETEKQIYKCECGQTMEIAEFKPSEVTYKKTER